jgi:hypothetical protein
MISGNERNIISTPTTKIISWIRYMMEYMDQNEPGKGIGELNAIAKWSRGLRVNTHALDSSAKPLPLRKTQSFSSLSTSAARGSRARRRSV